MKPVRIVGVGEFLPGPAVPNTEMERIFGLRADWIDTVIGTRCRHYALDLQSGQPAYGLREMAVEAARAALVSADWDVGDIDLVVMSTATPDHLMPSTVNLVCEDLGINEVPSYQIQSGCAGALQALQVACAMLGTGMASSALVMSADTSYKFLDLQRDFSRMPPSELVNIALFGDGAGAAVLSTNRSVPGLAVRKIVNRLEGEGIAPGHLLGWFAAQGIAPAESEQAAQEDYKAIEERVPVMASELLRELLLAAGKSRADIAHFMPPQLAGNMTDRIIERLELDPERCLNRVAEVGNAGNATPYFQLTGLWERAQAGEHAMLLAIESSKWIKTGMHLVMESA